MDTAIGVEVGLSSADTPGSATRAALFRECFVGGGWVIGERHHHLAAVGRADLSLACTGSCRFDGQFFGCFLSFGRIAKQINHDDAPVRPSGRRFVPIRCRDERCAALPLLLSLRTGGFHGW